jgi:molybdopterin adenylyltransferase
MTLPNFCDGWDRYPTLTIARAHCDFVEIMPRFDEHLRRPKAQGATV